MSGFFVRETAVEPLKIDFGELGQLRAAECGQEMFADDAHVTVICGATDPSDR